ncbi:MAG: enoyl-CoA hydratase/isomerase family protein, partial [Deltaproteobacteria bacterium]|nr:enoyl-CoA hydratase/isomerase family protein [Deltaproteobacteria bacterium]
MVSEESHVKMEMVEEGIALITLNRPDQGNAYTPLMKEQLDGFFRQCSDDDTVRVIVVTGAGRAFCVGADLASGGASFDVDSVAGGEPGRDAHFFGYQSKKPIIGALNGHTVGIGLTTALTWDFLFVAQEAKLAFPFVRRGIGPEMGSTYLLPRLVGLRRAIDLMLTGRTFSGAEAAAYGIALEALPADQVLSRAMEMAREIRDNCAPVSIAMVKKMIWDHLWTTDYVGAAVLEDRSWQWAGKHPDAMEGVMS